MERDLDPEEFRLYHDLIHRLTGIHYPADKRSLLSNRLRRRLRATGQMQYLAYLAHIQMPSQHVELQDFLDSITTNETYFFRCPRHWELFKEWAKAQVGLPETKRHGLRIWSAASSTGAEAYTILICLEQVLGEAFGGIRVEVLGTDLSQSVLTEARQGIYRPYALSQTPLEIQRRYFKQIDTEHFQIAPRLQPFITFKQHNLMNVLPNRTFDFVFLRNVMIYFDRPSKERVLGNMRSVLRPGGMLIVGESESLLNITHQLTYLHPSLFQEPLPVKAPVRA
ncbi:MAG: protein-glutamate O-methyltransferase CheR [Planctomycetota bacterium]|nr:protein-glutamate O-methyltransferase CheR [Planctomycetota bacterium]MSR37454.1 protein-glutamate O-methyltransferase CheR [Planctomycetota bacterium]